MDTAPSVMSFLRQRVICSNLVLMSLVWFTVNYNFILIGFSLKYFPGNLYTNAYAMSLSELLAYLVSGMIYTKFGMRGTFISFSVLSAIAGFLMVVSLNSGETG